MGVIISKLKLTTQEQADLISKLATNNEEMAKIIANMKLSSDKEKELVARLKMTIEEQQRLLDLIGKEKGKGINISPVIYILIGVVALVVVGVVWAMLKR